ncbi:phospholipid methyltransferase-domain-containing protein [Zopfochytrium polystomum]|nr:phospholipid methyltransferase-domain-containing protein [Zopfochytrium polystomum]
MTFRGVEQTRVSVRLEQSSWILESLTLLVPRWAHPHRPTDQPHRTVFPVPPTQPLWQALFFPANHQSVFEWSVLTFVGIGIFLFLALPLPPLFFLCAFLFWRFCYNVGLGLILWRQSSDKAVVRLVRRLGFGPNAGRRRGPWTAYFVREIQKKVNISDEEYDALPLDFISWMLFRGVADVVIANDLVAYILFALCYFEAPANGVLTWMDVLRYTAGVIMIVVNYWAKFEVDQTLLDYAWYWGDFFFLMDASPTHSGLFEAAPHPMYIVGFLGYYATALITKSYTVLFVSLLAHSMQLGFLFLVENPHMEKTYNRPFSTKGEDKTHDKMIMRSFFQRDLVIFRNFDLFRSTDLLTVCVWTYTGLAALAVGPVDSDWKLWQAVFWRFTYNWILGGMLFLQSRNKFWSRHFIKYGETPKEAFHHWKIIFNLCQSMTYISYFICAWRLYSPSTPPESWMYGTFLLKHILAFVLVMIHAWTAISIHKTLGDFGWFYGDFFIDSLRDSRSLTYTGVYRFLNHPNAWASTASAWGVTMACESWPLTILTVFGQASNWLFVRYVEGPHMRRQYGDKVRPRNEAGVEKANLSASVGSIASISSSSSQERSPLRRRKPRAASVEGKPFRVNSFTESMKEAMDRAKPQVDKLVQGAKNIVKRRVERLASLPLHLYTLTFPTVTPPLDFELDPTAARRAATDGLPEPKFRFLLGDPILIQFTCARETLKRKDWIGIYPVGSNLSDELTTFRSNGRWMFLTGSRRTLVSVRMSSEDQGLRVVTGRLEFRGARIPWSPGVYEARYHCDGGYAVVTRSEPFEVVAERFAWDDHDHLGAAAGDLEARVARAVRDFVERCLDVRHRPMWERGGGGGGGGGRQEEAMPWLEVDDDVMGRCWLPEDVASSCESPASFASFLFLSAPSFRLCL